MIPARSIVGRTSSFILVAVLLLVASAFPRSVRAAEPSTGWGSISVELDGAVSDLCEGEHVRAQRVFHQLAEDGTQPPLVRGLARIGLGESQLASGDPTAAMESWQRLASDTEQPRGLRDAAARRIAAWQRLHRGLPAYDPARHRVELSDLPPTVFELHVAPHGDDTAKGSAAQPLRSLKAARDAVRAWRKSQAASVPTGSVQVLVHGGRYPVDSTFQLTREDSGTDELPIVFRAAPGEHPVFDGGQQIVGWRTIRDPQRRELLDPAIRDRVLEADLNELGIRDWGDATDLRRRPELFCNGQPQTLARWPNEGFVQTGEVLGSEKFTVWNTIEGCRDGKFRFLEDRPTRWSEEPDVRLYGYWFWDWFEEYQRVATIDSQSRAFVLAPPFSNYGYRAGQRYFAVNVFRELDRPGEWYLDRRNGHVYWLPPNDLELASATIVLSVWDQPFVELEDVEHVRVFGLTFQNARGDGIHLRGGAENLIAGCTLRRLGGDAIVVQGGNHHGIFGCQMHTLGCGGMRVAGGDRSTLTPGNHFVENCTVQHISRLKRTYAPAVHLDGCGNRVTHNRFEHIPSSAMRIEGNDHVIELNLIRHVVEESDDQGGLDMFGNPLYRGVVIRWNRWSDIVGGTHCGAAGVRLDDMISGVTVQGNVFERCGAVLFGGVQIHGGKENLIDGNVFLDCFAGISCSRWPDERWRESIDRFLPQAKETPYATRYPELRMLEQDPNVNDVCRNVFAGRQSELLRDGGIQRTAANVTTTKPIDLGRLSDPAEVREDPDLRRALLDPIPVDDIGPYDHPWRSSNEEEVLGKTP